MQSDGNIVQITKKKLGTSALLQWLQMYVNHRMLPHSIESFPMVRFFPLLSLRQAFPSSVVQE